ncbi:hypothetical protein Glove_33g296 [Diversispora epigaea]|uniref:Uncharacterized protein n=1 Tax=Diversispora epigaea TaxID=1348612 RepID=A0A397JLA8_9GLOM|nr:hypothetical protein Glove_33g296 [Diversispora epigaea]
MFCWDVRITYRSTFEELKKELEKYKGYCENNNENTIQIKEVEEFSKNHTTTNTTTTTPKIVKQSADDDIAKYNDNKNIYLFTFFNMFTWGTPTEFIKIQINNKRDVDVIDSE